MKYLALYENFITDWIKKYKTNYINARQHSLDPEPDDSYLYEVKDIVKRKKDDELGMIFARGQETGVNKYWVDFNDFPEKWISKPGASIFDMVSSYTEDEIEKPTQDEIELYHDMKKYNV